MPSSSAFVDATPSSSPLSRRRSSSRRSSAKYPARYGATRSAISARPAVDRCSWVRIATVSAARRDRTNVSVRAPCSNSSADTEAASAVAG